MGDRGLENDVFAESAFYRRFIKEILEISQKLQFFAFVDFISCYAKKWTSYLDEKKMPNPKMVLFFSNFLFFIQL